MNWFWLNVWVLGLFVSIVVHEAAHVFVAKRMGWTYHGLMFKPLFFAVGVKLDPESEEKKGLWFIGIAGPISSVLLGLYFLGLSYASGQAGIVFLSLAALNFTVAVINLIPTPITDGGHILTGLFGWEMKWRYLVIPWGLFELAALIIFLL